MLTHHSRNGSQAQQQLQQQQQHLEIQKKHAKAERVRKLWTEFEQWLKHPRNEMERVRDHLLLQTANLNTHTAKISRRRIEEAHFSKAREEWQRRLRAADLKESDWEPINEAEMKAVEEALGVDDGEGYITDPSPSPPHRPFYAAASASTSSASATPLVPAENPANRSSSSLAPGPPMLLAPPMTSASRATSASSSSYECVRPEEFHSDDDEGSASDSEISFSTTISSIISEEDEAVGPVTEYIFTQALESELRPSVEVTKESNGPLLARNVPVSKAVDAGAGSQPLPSLAPPKRPPDARQQPQATTTSRSSSSSSSASVSKKPSLSTASTKLSAPAPSQSTARTTTKSSPPVASTSSAASSSSSKSQQQPSKSSRVNYPLVAPSLSDLSDYDEVENDAESDRLSPSLVAQFEAQFEVRKLEVRIEKIQRFHQLASEADVALSISIADGRRDHALSRQGEADLVQRHYESTVALRDRMEKERKEQVNEEKKRLREEYVWRSSHQRHNGLLQQQRPQPPVESDSEDEQEDEQKMWERMGQEQLALQAQFNSHEPPKAQVTRKRPGILTLDSMPSPMVAMNDKILDEANEVLTPRPTPKGAWSVKPSATRTVANVLGQSLSRKPEPVVQHQQQQFFLQETENGELEVDHEDTDNEKERENTGFWSYLTKKKAAPPPQAPQSSWNFPSSPVTKPPQKPTTVKSRLGTVISAWDDDFGADGQEAVEEVVAEQEIEKEELSQEKTPVIPLASAPNVSPANKKQTKKQRQGNKKGGGPSSATTVKAEKVEAPPAPAPAPASSSNTQKGPKTAPVGVPGKSGRKALDNDDISSTPRPNVLKRLQAQLANEEMFTDQEDETPTTPRPSAVKKATAAHPPNPWARKAMNKNVVDPAFDDDVAVDSTLGAMSSRAMLDQVNGKKVIEAVASSPQAPGAWSWPSTTTNDKAKASAEAPSTSRKNNGPARQVAVNGVDNTETNKKKGKKAQRGGNASGNVTNSASNSAWTIKKTTVEEVPDDEADDIQPSLQADKRLPYNSRSILEDMRNSPFDSEEQPRIHEPRPSKPRGVFESIIQYGEPAPDLVHDLQDELSWSEERIAQAVARMAQESAEMDRKVNGLNGFNGVNGLNGTNGYLPSSGSITNGVAGMGMNGAAHVNMANMNRVNMANMNGSVTAVNGFGLSKPAVDGATTTTKKQVRWQQQQQPQPTPSSLGGFDDLPRSQPLPSQAFVNKMSAVSRSYEGDEAFSPLASTNGGFPGFQSSTSSSAASSYASFGGRNTKMNGMSQFGGHHPFGDVEPEGNELDRAARSLLENIHVSVSSQQRNKPGFSAV